MSPKNKKPRGGRPAANFEPKYAKKTSFHDRTGSGGSTKPGSKSPKHRGYRPDDEAAPKRRWTAQEKAGREQGREDSRGEYRGDRDRQREDGPTRGQRWNDRSAERPFRGDRDGRAERPFRGDRDGRAERSFRGDRDDRGARSFHDGRDERAGRPPADRSQRGAGRSFDRRDRPFRADDRAAGPFRGGRDERAAGPRTGNRGSFRGDERSRDARPDYRGHRAERSNNRDNRGDHSGDRPYRGTTDGSHRRPPFRDSTREDRPSHQDRSSRNDRPFRENRPERTDRPFREASERPQRHDRQSGFGTRDHRDGSQRREYPDRPRREYPDRPRREHSDRPSRDNWSDRKPERTEKQEQRVDVVHERLQADAVDAATVADASFSDLGLGQNIVSVLAELGAASPFPIQAATIPSILEGRDVLGRGRTGSGKTIAFGAPLVESVLRAQAGTKRAFGRAPSAIILAPTRELALQIDRTVQPLAQSVGLFTTQIYGGVPQARQVGALRKGVDIVIGTPGRIEDLIRQGRLDLSQVKIAVLDEADHMCELGFLEPVQRILRLAQDGSQKLLFSATLDREVAALVDEFLVEPAVYEVAGEDQDSSTIEHRVLVIDHRDKAEILASLVDRDGKTLIFSRTRAYAEMLAEQLEDVGVSALALHGDLNQAKRTRNLQRLTSGRVQVLVATDVAARGIHVDDIDLVVQADAPDEYKTYLHRSGRTGRAGRAGRVVTLITRQRRRRMEDMLDRARITAPFESARPGDDLLDALAGRMTEADLTR